MIDVTELASVGVLCKLLYAGNQIVEESMKAGFSRGDEHR